MTATLSPARLMSPSSLRYGVWRPLLGLIQSHGAQSGDGEWLAQWQLNRQCAVSPQRVLSLYLGFSALLLLVAVKLWLTGEDVALPFAAGGVLISGLAVLLYTRHASDCDLVAMKASLVRIERHRAGQISRVDFNPRWVRVEPDQQDGSLVRLSGQGRSVVVGDYVPREARPQLAEEFRWALRHLND